MKDSLYDPNNIFAKIIRGEIPCKKLDECRHTLTFFDINPQAPIHVLIIPKGSYVDMNDFIGRAAKLTGAFEGGYRIISNMGGFGHQEVPHLHAHLLGGESIGPIRSR